MIRPSVLLFPFLCSLGVGATPVCQLGTLADYIALGSMGCTINDKRFANFMSVHTAYGGATPATDTAIAVAPIVQVGPAILDPGPGLLFSTGSWTAFAGQIVNTTISFTVTVLNPLYLLSDATLTFAGAARGTNAASTVSETILPSGTGLLVGDLPGTGSDVFSDKKFYLPVKSITVLKDIQAAAGSGNDNFAKISLVQQTYSQLTYSPVLIPEPGTLAVVGGTLLLFGVIRRQ